ncbi:hypothetical protein QJQ45_001218 [Haematococcus lacustris]|nr:hypothetical protein QJQ45_001218 [Haematococcus lacustris]
MCRRTLITAAALLLLAYTAQGRKLVQTDFWSGSNAIASASALASAAGSNSAALAESIARAAAEGGGTATVAANSIADALTQPGGSTVAVANALGQASAKDPGSVASVLANAMATAQSSGQATAMGQAAGQAIASGGAQSSAFASALSSAVSNLGPGSVDQVLARTTALIVGPTTATKQDGVPTVVYGPIWGTGKDITVSTCFSGAVSWDSILVVYRATSATATRVCRGDTSLVLLPKKDDEAIPNTNVAIYVPAGLQLVADQLARWKLTKGQVRQADGLNNSLRDTQRWLAPVQPHLQHLAAASSAGTLLEANLNRITVTLATWDAVWEMYLDPKWARQRLRLTEAQDRALGKFFKKLKEEVAELSMERHGRAKQLVFFGAASSGTRGGWGADAVLRACYKVECGPRGIVQLQGRVVLVDERRTSRVSSAVYGRHPSWSQQRDQPVRGMMWCPVDAPRKPPQAPCSSQAATQPAASQPGPSSPPPAKRSKRTKAEQAAEPTQPIKGKGKAQGKAARAKPAPQAKPSQQPALPAKGKAYPGLGYKRLRDRPPKASSSSSLLRHCYRSTLLSTDVHYRNAFVEGSVGAKHATDGMVLPGAAGAVTPRARKPASFTAAKKEQHWGKQQQELQDDKEDVVLLACRKVLRRPSSHKQGAGRLLCKVVLVDEPRTSQVSSSANRPQPCEQRLDREQPTRHADCRTNEPPPGVPSMKPAA